MPPDGDRPLRMRLPLSETHEASSKPAPVTTVCRRRRLPDARRHLLRVQGKRPPRATRYDEMCEAFGGYGEYVTKPQDIRPALERAQAKVDEGMVALVNVRTDYRPRYGGVRFSDYPT
jgi:hypothetical protein